MNLLVRYKIIIALLIALSSNSFGKRHQSVPVLVEPGGGRKGPLKVVSEQPVRVLPKDVKTMLPWQLNWVIKNFNPSLMELQEEVPPHDAG